MKASRNRIAAGILILAAAAAGQPRDSSDYGRGHSFPWIAHSSVDLFYLQSPADAGATHPYQAAFYQGFTIQSLSFAWFHLGVRSRETYVEGLGKPYREPVVLKLQASAELLPGLAFASLGGNIPLAAGDFRLDDTLALYQALNGYSPLPHSDFLSPQALQAAVFGRLAGASWTLLAGAAYVRATVFRGLPGESFYPPAYFDLFGRWIVQGADARQRVDARASLYRDEENGERIAAHREGALYQVRYEWLKSLRKVGWQLGGGAAGKPPDRNRRIRLASELPLAGVDDNLQRAYGEAALTWVPSPAVLWRVHLLPKALFSWNGEHAGFEAESGISVALKIWEYHRLRATGTLLGGELDGRRYLGFGLRAEFAFRHLGIQDADTGPESDDAGG
jgi:hypothetical protein